MNDRQATRQNFHVLYSSARTVSAKDAILCEALDVADDRRRSDAQRLGAERFIADVTDNSEGRCM